MIKNVNIVINCAASVDFNARLDESLQINVFGTFNMFKLAQNFQRLENFIHVKFPVDPYSFAKQLLYPQSWRVTTKTWENPFFGNYPNTYTFTKFISEHVLKDKRP